MTDHPEHDLNDPRCMIEGAMGWEHGSRWDGEAVLTPGQVAVWDRASDLDSDIVCNHGQGTAARNDAERRIYAELDRAAEKRDAVTAYNHGGLLAVSPEWLETEAGRDFLAECREAAEMEAGA